MTTIARAVHLAERPVGCPTDATWSILTRELAPLKGGEVLVMPTHLCPSTPPCAGGCEGRLVSHEHVVAGGVDRFAEALHMIFNGLNTGKLVLKM